MLYNVDQCFQMLFSLINSCTILLIACQNSMKIVVTVSQSVVKKLKERRYIVVENLSRPNA